MTLTTHTYNGQTIGVAVSASDATDLNTVAGSPEYTYGLSGAVSVRLPDCTTDYLYYDSPTTDYSGTLTFRVDDPPASGALRVVVIRDNLNGDLSQFRVHSDGSFEFTDINTAQADDMGTWTAGETYQLQWQVDDTAETVTWRITSMTAGSSHTEGVADFSAWSGSTPARIYVGGPGTSSASVLTVDTLMYDDNSTLSWLPSTTLRTGLFHWDSTDLIEVPVSTSGTSGAAVVAASDAPEAVKQGADYRCDGTADEIEITMALQSHGAVILSPGTFEVNSSITMPQQSSLIGAGTGKTELVGGADLADQFILINMDHCTVANLTISSGDEAAADGIVSNATSSSGFVTGADQCTTLTHLVLRNITGDGIVMSGSNNRDCKLSQIHVWNATGMGYHLNCPDGSAHQIVAGTCGSHGVVLGTSSSNWRISNAKSWYSDGDGFLIQSVRHTLSQIEAQDNELAGIRILGYFVTVNGFLADSNSWYGDTSLQNVHSGVEVGRTSAGSTSGGSNVILSNGQAWDKNESSRGRCQAYGVRLRTGVRDLVLANISTGNGSGGSHSNYTDGILFDTSSDMTHASNAVVACWSHSVDVTGGGGAASSEQTVYKATTGEETTVTGTTLTADDELTAEGDGGQTRFLIRGVILYRADSTTHAKIALVPSIVSGSGTVEGFAQYSYTDTSGNPAVTQAYLNTSGSNAITAIGASSDADASSSTGEVRAVHFEGSCYFGGSVTTGAMTVKVAESGGTDTGVKIIVGSWMQFKQLGV